MNRERFRFFGVIHHESDLLIGVPHQNYLEEMKEVVERELKRLRHILIEYSERDPGFLTSLDPVDKTSSHAAEEILTMMRCGQATSTGPMAAVAGLFAQKVGEDLTVHFGEMEVVVENGGDLYLKNSSDLVSVIHAGNSALSGKMAFIVPPGTWGICTSSGTVGHSFSRGRADAVTVISSSAPLSDSWATAIANRVQSKDDVDRVLESIAGIPEIAGCAVIVDNHIGVRGELEVKLLPSGV
jgi:uncharacterized protein